MIEVALIGAGPYGLSIAAHLRRKGITFRVFGRPMESWLSQMPKGMMLKSDGFASNLYDPAGEFTLERFCAEQSIEYKHTGLPVSLETFVAYGCAFQKRLVPALEDRRVTAVERLDQGFLLRLDDGERFAARRVVLAVGITHFGYLPEDLVALGPEFVSHSREHTEPERFRGRKVVVLGAGASALDLAGLLHQAGADVELVSRRQELVFHSRPNGKARSVWAQIRHPRSGLGPGLRSRFFADAPLLFSYLPAAVRLWNVRRALGPSGGWFSKEAVVGRVPLRLGYTVDRAEVRNNLVHLRLRGANGDVREVVTEHVIAATGYKVDLERLNFLSASIRQQLKTIDGAPRLRSSFESSVPGLYFAGVAAANSFGPVMRFAFGARFAAERLSGAIAKSVGRKLAAVPVARLIGDVEN